MVSASEGRGAGSGDSASWSWPPSLAGRTGDVRLRSVEWFELQEQRYPVHKIVTGQKTWLRPASWGFSEDELHRRYQWSLDDDLQYWSGTIPGGRSYTQFKDTVLERDWPSDGRRISYAIFTSNEGMIGMVSCYGIDWQRGVGEIGVYLGIKSLWGRGYGTDALRT